MAACRGLTELTIAYPHPEDTSLSKTGDALDTVELAHSATLHLVKVCKGLPDFDTIQIVYFLPGRVLFQRKDTVLSPEQVEQVVREQVKGVTDLAIDCLKEPGMGCWKREGRKITVRVIELSLGRSMRHLGPVKVEEYEV